MSNIYKSSNVNYTNNIYELKFEVNNLPDEKLLSNNNQEFDIESMNLEDQKQLFYVELEKEKKDIISKTLLEAQVQAEEIKEKAINNAEETANALKEEAEAILQQAQEKKAQIEQEAYETGYSKGINDSNNLVEEANKILSDITNVRQQTMDNLEVEIVSMVGTLFEKVIGIELDKNNETIIKLIQKTLSDFSLKHSIVIKVSEADYENVLDNKATILSNLRDMDDFEVTKSDALAKGDCVIQTASGEIDCSISVQLGKIRQCVKNLLMME